MPKRSSLQSPLGKFHFLGCQQFGWRLIGEGFAQALEQELRGGVGLSVAGELK